MRSATRVALSSLMMLVPMLTPLTRAEAVGLCGDQFGTSQYDSANGIATDGSNIWVSGITFAAMPGLHYKGSGDVFLRKYNSSCTVQWTKEFGTSGVDQPFGIVVDASGNSYVSGKVSGKLKGMSYSGLDDVFVRAYDPNGKVLWTKEFGTPQSDFAFDMALSGSRLFVVGYAGAALPGQTYLGGGGDAFVAAIGRASGKMLWTRQFGTKKYEEAEAVAVYGGTVFVSGMTDGQFNGQPHPGKGDIFMRRYSTSGAPGSTIEFGTTLDDSVGGMGVDASGAVIGGTTMGAFPTFTNVGGVQDGFVVALDNSGATAWTRQFGTSSQDLLKSLVIQGSTVWVSGDSFGGLGEGSPQGDDVYVGTMNRSDGTGFSVYGFGTSGYDEGNAMIGTGIEVLIAGDSDGAMGGANLGSSDAYFQPCCA